MNNFLTQNLDFRGHLSTFRPEKTPKSRPSKAKNNAQKIPKELQNNFEIRPPKWPKMTLSNVKSEQNFE